MLKALLAVFKGVLQQLLHLCLVQGANADGRRRQVPSTGVLQLAAENVRKTGRHKRPGAHVSVLFLAPN